MIIIHAMNRKAALPRALLPSLKQTLARSPVVVLTGARQTGKTTLVHDLLQQQRRYLTLDDFDVAERAAREPEALLDSDEPLTLDEVQREPRLLLAIKRRVDQRRIPGQYLLTGSANLALLGTVSESLAGRAVYKTLMPLTLSERLGKGGCGCWAELLDAPTALQGRKVPAVDLKEWILRGGFPLAAMSRDEAQRAEWMDGYVRSYLERDLQMLSSIDQLADFRRLMRLVALRTGKLMNQSEMARDAGLSQPTTHRYLGLLETSHLLSRLPAYAVNRTKRLVKSPRLFLCDTGLACHLAGIQRVGQLAGNDLEGFLLENAVLSDLLVWRETQVVRPEILYWRTQAGQEVDLVIEHHNRVTPVEVKMSLRARLDDVEGLAAFLNEYDNAPHGILLYAGTTVERLTERIWAIPLGLALLG